jgi:hypothetical protein
VHSARQIPQRTSYRHKQSLYDIPTLQFLPANHSGHIRIIERAFSNLCFAIWSWTHWDVNPELSACEPDVIPLHHMPLGSFEAAGRSACIEATSSRRCSCAQLGRRRCGLPTVGSRLGIAIGGFGGSQSGILSGVSIGAPNVKVPNGNAHWRIPTRNSN